MANPDYEPLAKEYRTDMEQYIKLGLLPGSWLARVLSNDLAMAIHEGTPIQVVDLPDVVRWLIRFAPAKCWGSPEIMMVWSTSRRSLWNKEGTA